MSLDELEALVILNSLDLIGSVKIRHLIQHYGSAEAALQAPVAQLKTLPGFGPKILQAWVKGLEEETWRQDLQLAQRLEAQIVPFTSPLYPQRLLNTSDYPLILYVQGVIKPKESRCLAIIGTRQATHYGLEMAHQISKELAQAGWTIVSGLARGIDTAAHRGTLEGGGQTIAVLGSGLAHIYPSENSELARRIGQQGAVISEFSMKTPPDRQRFPQRNRLVSGMTRGTLLIEAPIQSGAMLTVERARVQGRDVFVLPGRADQPNFRGNHLLIKGQKGHLVENAQDILAYYEEDTLSLFKQVLPPSLVKLEKEEIDLMQRLPQEELSIEELINHTQLPVNKLNVLLMSLVLKKVIKEYPGKIYKKI